MSNAESSEKSLTPERDKYMKWLEAEKAKGLKGVHFSMVDGKYPDGSEEFFAEVNRMLEAPEIPITDEL